jgi:hypothetical protein
MSRVLYPAPLANSPELVTLKFRIQLAATTGDPDFQVPANSIATATAETNGVYTMTMNEFYPVFVGGFGSYMCDAEDNVFHVNIKPSDYDASTGILTVTLFTDDGDGTYTAENGVADDWVYFELTFCRRNQLAPSGAIA